MPIDVLDQVKDSTIEETPSSTHVVGLSPFNDKVLYDGGKLFKREHGVLVQIDNIGLNIADFVIPYPNCKITGTEILYGKKGDKINFKVLDSDNGIIQLAAGVPVENVVPNLLLNQFAFQLNVAENYHIRQSSYDADLIAGLVIRIEYD